MRTCKLAVAAMAIVISSSVAAHEGHADGKGDGPGTGAGKGQEQRTLLQQRALPDLPGKTGILATVRYAPGQESLPHEHPGSVYAYVLEGEVVSQLEGEAPVTYKAGDSWYEPPHAGHLVSKNASKTRPATLVVFLITGTGEPIAKPR